MSFSKIMSIIGLVASVAGGIVAATLTAPAWVVPALGGLAYIAGHMASSPADTSKLAQAKSVTNDVAKVAKDMADAMPANDAAQKAAKATKMAADSLSGFPEQSA